MQTGPGREREGTGRNPAINMQGSLGRAAASCVVITWHFSLSVCITAVIPDHPCNLSLSLIFTTWKDSTSEVQSLQYYSSANWTRIKNRPKVTHRRKRIQTWFRLSPFHRLFIEPSGYKGRAAPSNEFKGHSLILPRNPPPRPNDCKTPAILHWCMSRPGWFFVFVGTF